MVDHVRCRFGLRHLFSVGRECRAAKGDRESQAQVAATVDEQLGRQIRVMQLRKYARPESSGLLELWVGRDEKSVDVVDTD